jgi:molybdopterin synthase catalytic subunit
MNEQKNMISLPSVGVYEKGSLNLLEILARIDLIYSSGRDGAVATYIGVARNTSREGKAVSYVEIEAYEENANLEILKICRELAEKYELSYVGIWHLTGKFMPGEPIVLVVVSGRRRASVLEALKAAIERYKTEPAIFKKEVYPDGTHRWVEEGH